MNLIAVVVQSPHPIPVSTGAHLLPGEIAEIEDNDYNRMFIDNGALSVLARVPTPEAIEAASRKPRRTTTDDDENPPKES